MEVIAEKTVDFDKKLVRKDGAAQWLTRLRKRLSVISSYLEIPPLNSFVVLGMLTVGIGCVDNDIVGILCAVGHLENTILRIAGIAFY